jgi:uncharacterized membrane protein
MDDSFRRLVTAVVAGVALVAWAAAVVAGVIYSFKSGDDPDFIGGDGMKFFMPGLTALVGGVVAAAFGIEAAGETRTDRNLTALGSVLTGTPAATSSAEATPVPRRQLLGRWYIGVYLAFGLAAAVTWIINGGDTVEYVRTLASAWGGLFLGIAQAAFRN